MKRVPLAVGSFLLLLAIAGSAAAQVGAKGVKTAPTRTTAAGPGLIAFVDLKTGQLVEPSPEDAALLARSAELRRGLNDSFEGLTEVTLPGGGGVLVDLQGRFQTSLVASIGPDGKLRMGHAVAKREPSHGSAPPSKGAAEGERK